MILAGDALLLNALREMHACDHVSFIKNNIDHYTGATFGCHENYLMRRETQFTPPVLGTLLCFLATRRFYTGAGRIGRRIRWRLILIYRRAQRRCDSKLASEPITS